MILHHFLFSLPTTDDDPTAEPTVPATPAGQKRRRPRTMATVLVGLWRSARQRTQRLSDFEYRLEMVRADLGTDVPSGGRMPMGMPSHEKDADWRNLETLVLLDEFLKEIYSILQV